MTVAEAAKEFLSQETIAVAGVSRSGQAVGNAIYKKLKETGHTVYATHPEAETLEGDPCYRSLADMPEKPDGVVITTAPDAAKSIVEDCIAAGVPRVWMHRSFGQGSYSDEAEMLGREKGLTVIAGGCPMMFCEPVDVGHKCIRWIAKVTGKMPDVG